MLHAVRGARPVDRALADDRVLSSNLFLSAKYAYYNTGFTLESIGPLTEQMGISALRGQTFGSTNGNYFNDIFGGEDNFTLSGFPNADTDIYGNKLSHAWDDAIEAEGANRNVRIWGNYIDRTAIGIASSMASGVRRNFGTMTKPFHPGQAARNGVIAAKLAADHELHVQTLAHGIIVLEQSQPEYGNERRRLRVVPEQTAWLETACDEVNPTLPNLKSFVLPGGTPAAAQLHVCRTVCRRAERRALLVEDANPEVVRYLNRLSDLLFILARHANRENGDVMWVPGGER